MESKDNSIKNLAEKILAFLKAHPVGVTSEKLNSAIPFKEDSIAQCLNILIDQNRLNIIETPDGNLFKYVSEKEAQKIRDLTKEEISVYEIIMQSGNIGINTMEIKLKLNIDNSKYINKILTKLEKKKLLIKSVKVLNARNKKVWMGINIEPSQEVTGGIWCDNQEFNNKLVSVFLEKCNEYIAKQNKASRKEILLYAKSLNLTEHSSEMKEDDIQKILNILIFDGKIEPIFPLNIDSKFLENKYSLLLDKGHPDQELVRYRKIKEYNTTSVYDYLPCTVCPSFNECNINNLFNPLDCLYNKDLFGDLEEQKEV